MKKSELAKAGYQLSGLMMAQGAITIIFGILALVWPGVTLATLSILVAIWLFISGLVGALTSIFMRDNYEHWILRLILSLVQFGVGAYLVQRPDVTIETFVLAIGITFVVQGVIDMVFSFAADGEDGGLRVLNFIVGLLTIGGGVLIWRYPVSGSLAFVWVLGFLALVTGTITLWQGIDTRNQIKDAK